MSISPIQKFLTKLGATQKVGKGYKAKCPAHDDQIPSLCISEGEDERVLIKCQAGCSTEEVLNALNLRYFDLFSKNEDGRRVYTSSNAATLQPHKVNGSNLKRNALEDASQPSATAQLPIGCTLTDYAKSKQLPEEFLKQIGLKDVTLEKQKAIRILYYDENGNEGPIRFRFELFKSENRDNRFKWRRGSKPTLYGLEKRSEAIRQGYVVLVEGESDCHTAWFHGIPAFGIPGASNWNEKRDAQFLNDIQKIYIVDEQDQGGVAIRKWLATSQIRDRAFIVRLRDVKDLSELHCDNPSLFQERWNVAISEAVSWSEIEWQASNQKSDQAWLRCQTLARENHILNRFAEKLSGFGVAGETSIAKILYLAITSRWLDRPVSVVVKGPSSGGKSYITERTLKFFPEKAFYALSGMSERALAYSNEPLSNRFLIIYEAAGLRGDFATYLVRSLLSEGHVRYETVEKTIDGIQPRLIEREGPTGLIVTTTSLSLHPENETRMLSLTVTDTPEQTRMILLKLAEETPVEPDLGDWIALQEWLDNAEHRVTIPFAMLVAEKIQPVATRLRRDFTMLLNLIRAHALLHQARRQKDREGRIIATLDDYEIVRDLVSDFIAEGVGATISVTIRETVNAVSELTNDCDDSPTNITAVARKLDLDKSTAKRRVAAAIQHGYVRNLESRKGRQAQLIIGENLPDNKSILPTREMLEVAGLQTVAMESATDDSHNFQLFKSNGCRVAEECETYMPYSTLQKMHCQSDGCNGDVSIIAGRGHCDRCGLLHLYKSCSTCDENQN